LCGGLAIYSGIAENFRRTNKWPKWPRALNILLLPRAGINCPVSQSASAAP
jgi:hypothetical protein